MSHLKALKLTSAIPTRASSDPVVRTREKMITALAEQKRIVEAKIAGQHFVPTHKVRRKNAEGQLIVLAETVSWYCGVAILVNG